VILSWARLAHPLVAGLFVACAVVQGVPRRARRVRRPAGIYDPLQLRLCLRLAHARDPRTGARWPDARRITGLSALILVLFALQSVFVALRPAMPALAALHPLNGFAILAVASITTRASWAVRRERARVTGALDGKRSRRRPNRADGDPRPARLRPDVPRRRAVGGCGPGRAPAVGRGWTMCAGDAEAPRGGRRPSDRAASRRGAS
jgi:hypothetical protein